MDLTPSLGLVRSGPESGHRLASLACPLSAISRQSSRRCAREASPTEAARFLGHSLPPQRWDGGPTPGGDPAASQGSELHHRPADDLIVPLEIEIFVDLVEIDGLDGVLDLAFSGERRDLAQGTMTGVSTGSRLQDHDLAERSASHDPTDRRLG